MRELLNWMSSREGRKDERRRFPGPVTGVDFFGSLEFASPEVGYEVWSINSVHFARERMKPNRPRLIASTRNHITIGWDSLDVGGTESTVEATRRENEEEEGDRRKWFVLEMKDRVLGWKRVYMGFKTQTDIGPLAPGDYYEFRLKVVDSGDETEWSDTLVSATKDDLIPVSQLHRAVENGPVATLRKVLAQRLSSVDVPNRQGQTSLRLAISKKKITFMGILLNHGADIGHAETGSGRTPLMTAAQLGHLEAVQLLLERGSLWQVKDRNGLTALNYAVDNSHLPIVQLAVEEGVDVKTKDNFGWTALMRGDVLSYLLENGSSANEMDEKRRQTVLMQAVLTGRPEVVELLIKKGADLSVRNVYGHSAYDMAVNSTNEDMVKMSGALMLGSEEDPRQGLKKKGSGKMKPETNLWIN